MNYHARARADMKEKIMMGNILLWIIIGVYAMFLPVNQGLEFQILTLSMITGIGISKGICLIIDLWPQTSEGITE